MNPPRCQLLAESSRDIDGALLDVRFGLVARASVRGWNVPLEVLSGAAREGWIGDAPLASGQYGAFRYTVGGPWLAGSLDLPESAAQDIETLTAEVYGQLLGLTRRLGRPHWVRVWNYLHDLTAGDGDDERYRRFCVGRARALEAPDFESRLPAATVIGTRKPGFRLGFLACSSAPTPIENPRQTPAFRYPRAYGPKSPSFSRATRLGDTLWLSGTAAVIGHETRHPFDAQAQTGEMLANVDSLLEAAGAERWRAQALKLYVADPALASELRQRVQRHFTDDAPLTVLHGEICRRDLRVEIEGVFTCVPA